MPSAEATVHRHLPIGAEVQRGGGVHFRVWAPASRDLGVVLDEGGPTAALQVIPLIRGAGGYFEGTVAHAGPGSRYWYRLADGHCYPDPASRCQPDGPHGPSQVVDSTAFVWTDSAWTGVTRSQLVIYEMHVGTFTKEGTWAAARGELAALAELGITAIEMMPIGDFPGRFGWGYDGVNLFAPTRLYGPPDDLRAFVNDAHGLGIGVLLDVVYNHVGPDGCFLRQFSDAYFSPVATEWGDALNFDGPGSPFVREFVLANAAYWIAEFHFDGLRLDAIQAIHDRSTPHIIAEICTTVRHAAGPRAAVIVGEDEPQKSEILRSVAEGGWGADALWNDDFHHCAMVALTGKREAYYTDYLGTPQEFVSAAKHGFLYQGQWYSWQDLPRGTPARGIPPAAFITFLQNHDQVANSATGQRAHALTSPGRYRALTALLLLGPGTPMLMQGQEFAASAPFYYFADHRPELGARVREGRREFMSQFASMASRDDDPLPDPSAPATFMRCKLNHDERELHGPVFALHAALLQLRASDPTLSGHGAYGLDGAVISPNAFILRYFGPAGETPATATDDRLLLINLGNQLEIRLFPEPLLAPPASARWTVLWSSEDALYDGVGMADVIGPDRWCVPAECTLVFGPVSLRIR